MTNKEISKRLNFTKTNTSMVLNTLKRVRFINIIQSKNDRRCYDITMTTLGKAYAETANMQEEISKRSSGTFRLPNDEDERELWENVIKAGKAIRDFLKKRGENGK